MKLRLEKKESKVMSMYRPHVDNYGGTIETAGIVVFKSDEEYFKMETTGQKNYTVRFLDKDDPRLIILQKSDYLKLKTTYVSMGQSIERIVNHVMWLEGDGKDKKIGCIIGWER